MFKRVSVALILIISMLVVVVIFGFDQTISDEVSVVGRPASTSTLVSNKYTQADDPYVEVSNPYVTVDGYTKLAENDHFILYYKEIDLSIRILDKATNYIWGSSLFTDYTEKDEADNYLYPELVDEGDRDLSPAQKRNINSPIRIWYYYGTEGNSREESFLQSATSTKSVQLLSNGFEANLVFGTSQIEMDLEVILTDSGVEVSVPFDSIVEHSTFKLKNVIVYPFMGAIKRNRMESGYLLIPEGVGALIRFKESEGKGTYNGLFYGEDQGLSASVSLDSIRSQDGSLIQVPSLGANMFGVIHGEDQNGLLTIIESGASYASFSAKFSNPNAFQITNFEVSFNYRHSFTQKMNQSGTNLISLITENAHPFDIKINYVLLNNEEANYVGLAKKYREVYLDKTETDRLEVKDNISLHLDILGAENKPGIFGNNVFKMTSLEEVKEIIDVLDIDLTISYHGFQKGGYTNTAPGGATLSSTLGSSKLIKELNELDKVKLFYSINYVEGYEGGSGFSISDLAKKVNLELITDYNRNNFVSYNSLKPSYSLKKLENDYDNYLDMGIMNIALEQIGNKVFSSYSSGKMTREEAIKTYQAMLEVFDNSALYNAYAYGWNADVIFNTQLYHSNNAMLDDTIPFIPLVLSGYTELYGRHANFFSNTQNELLRLVEYNVWPSFYTTAEPSHELLKTGSKNIYTSRFIDWETEILRQYNYVNNALKHVVGAEIVDRNYLALGVYEVKYSNHKVIYVNYSGTDYINGSLIIKSNDYLVGDYL